MKISILFISLLFFTGAAHSADKNTTKNMPYPEMTTDMRAKMADMHQQMATCLKSEKSFEECRGTMTNNCHEFGQMMPMMNGHHGMMGGNAKGMGTYHHGMMGGYPGMMTGFCDDQWLQEDTTKSKTKKSK